MRHRKRGRKLGRNASHRKAMFRNMACSLIRSSRVYEDDDDPGAPKVPGRIVTTLPKAKELRPIVEKLITLARKAREYEKDASQYATNAERNSDEWRSWRKSEKWNQWNQAIAPAVALRRRAFAQLRDDEAVDILFDELASRFLNRDGGYTRVIRIAERRLGDAGEQAFIEFVGENDRVKTRRRSEAPVVINEDDTDTEDEETTATATADEESGTEESAEETAEETATEEAATEEASGDDAKESEEKKEE